MACHGKGIGNEKAVPWAVTVVVHGIKCAITIIDRGFVVDYKYGIPETVGGRWVLQPIAASAQRRRGY